MRPVHFALRFKRNYYAYASQHSLGLILTEEALYSTEIATENSLIQSEIDAEKRILQRNFLSHLNSWTKYPLRGRQLNNNRSRIGSHDSFVKTKAVLSRLRGRFWNITFMMLYLNVFYLPTLKRVVGQYKMWNEVKFWFTQMTLYNICIPLIANDVEEDPGPTIFEVIDSTRTVCAYYNQGNEVLFGENAGKQCVAMSLTAIIYHHIEDINLWRFFHFE